MASFILAILLPLYIRLVQGQYGSYSGSSTPYDVLGPSSIPASAGEFEFPDGSGANTFTEGATMNISWATMYETVNLWLIVNGHFNSPVSIASNYGDDSFQWTIDCHYNCGANPVPFALRIVDAQRSEQDQIGGGFFSRSFWIQPGTGSHSVPFPRSSVPFDISGARRPSSSIAFGNPLAPGAISSVPFGISSAPVVSSSVPFGISSAPVVSSSVPFGISSDPVVSSSVPFGSSGAPRASSSVPFTKTAPAATTSKASTTSNAPTNTDPISKQAPSPSFTWPSHPSNSNNKMRTGVGIGVGVGVAMLGIGAFFFWRFHSQRMKRKDSQLQCDCTRSHFGWQDADPILAIHSPPTGLAEMGLNDPVEAYAKSVTSRGGR